MSDVPAQADEQPRRYLLSIWWRPRDAIEGIVAGPPNHFLVLLLAVLGGAASAVNTLSSFGVGTDLIDWRVLLGCLVVGGVFSVLNLYVAAFIASWLGRRMGGSASAAAVRAAFAWAMLPVILGLMVVLLLVFVLRSIAAAGAEPLPHMLQLVGGAFGIWAAILALLMLARVERFGFWKTIVLYGVVAWLLPFLVALGIRSFLYQPFSVPSASNMPTLLVGDNVFATKYAYGYSRYSLPFAPPLFSGRIFASKPALGDLVVFRLPQDGRTDYVKRIVGLPGDRVQMKEGLLYINDTPVQRVQIDDFAGTDACGTQGDVSVKRWRETLPNGVSYETLDCVNHGFYDITSVYIVPAGHVFTIGDNRDNSIDSRVLSSVGYIPFDNIIGRIGMIFFSAARGAEGEPAGTRWDRIGTLVR
jgi:signal peptidase I